MLKLCGGRLDHRALGVRPPGGEPNRPIGASAATATGPCGAANTAGSLTSASYTSTYTYDARTRLTGVGGSGAASFSFGSGLPGTAPLDGVTANGSASYSYDAAGDRTNAGATTGDIYDAERRLVSWSITGGSGKEAYDGEGHRVAHSTTSGITTTTTYYVGNLEEVDAASGAVTKYYPTPAGTPAALRVGTSGVGYLATDGLGSVSEALDGSGNVTATALYGPYGQTRYSTGTMPTAKGYTGQRMDAASGLDYYNARYYDPATNQFVSADSAAAGLNRYAYVAGNPETATDPTGHRIACGPDDGCGGGTGGGGTGNGTGNGGGSGCTSDAGCGCYSSCGGGDSGGGAGGGFSGTGTRLDALLVATCTGGPLQCRPTPEPVPCANVQNQCTTPPSNTDEPYDTLRQIAYRAEAAFWALIDDFEGLKQEIEGLLKSYPDLTKGFLHNMLLGLDDAIALLSNTQHDFFIAAQLGRQSVDVESPRSVSGGHRDERLRPGADEQYACCVSVPGPRTEGDSDRPELGGFPCGDGRGRGRSRRRGNHRVRGGGQYHGGLWAILR